MVDGGGGEPEPRRREGRQAGVQGGGSLVSPCELCSKGTDVLKDDAWGGNLAMFTSDNPAFSHINSNVHVAEFPGRS